MKQYLDLMNHVLTTGTRKENRTGIDTLSTFGYYYEHDLGDGFPLLKIAFHALWSHIKERKTVGCHLNVVLGVSNKTHHGYVQGVHEFFELGRGNGALVNSHAHNAQ